MIEVAAAIIENEQGQLLIAKRKKGKSQAGFWEFPGGKIEKGESVEACLKRELLEEMKIAITPYEPFGRNDHLDASAPIRLIAHKAKFSGGEITLADHDEYRWVHPTELHQFQFAPADIKFVEMLQENSSGKSCKFSHDIFSG